jgi:flagellar protein FliL
MSKEKAAPEEKPKGGKMKKIIMMAVAAIIMIGGGVGAGLYASGKLGAAEHKEDPNRPKLVARSEEPQEAAEGEAGKEAPPKVGTVSVENDLIKPDPRKYEITYIPIEQNLTANLADGQGFVQVGLSLATYYDGKLVANIKRQIIPIRSVVLMTLSEQDGTVLASTQGKQQLQQLLTKAINRVLREKEGFGGVDNVYFTSLVVQ